MSRADVRRAARALCEVACAVRPGEAVSVLWDNGADLRVVDGLEAAARDLGAAPRRAHVEVASGDLGGQLAAALDGADVALDVLSAYAFHHPRVRRALDGGLRYGCFPQLDAALLCRCASNGDAYRAALKVGEAVAGVLRAAHSIRVVTAQSELTMSAAGCAVDHAAKPAARPGEITYLAGQVSWYPSPESLRGSVSIDGLSQPFGTPKRPVRIAIRAGRIASAEGGEEADQLRSWFSERDDPDAQALSHLSVGLLPEATPSRGVVEAEREMGAFVVGVGAQPPGLGIFGERRVRIAEHIDLIARAASLVVDGMVIIDRGTLRLPGLPQARVEFETREEAE